MCWCLYQSFYYLSLKFWNLWNYNSSIDHHRFGCWMMKDQILFSAFLEILCKTKKFNCLSFCIGRSFFELLNQIKKLWIHLPRFGDGFWKKTICLCSFFEYNQNENHQIKILLVPSDHQLFICSLDFRSMNDLNQSCRESALCFLNFCIGKSDFHCFFDLNFLWFFGTDHYKKEELRKSPCNFKSVFQFYQNKHAKHYPP